MLFDNGNSDGGGRGEFKIYILVFFSRCSDMRNALLRIVSPKDDLRRDFNIFSRQIFTIFRFLKIVDFLMISELVEATQRGYGSAYLRKSRISTFPSVENSHLSKWQGGVTCFFRFSQRFFFKLHGIILCTFDLLFSKFRGTRKYLVAFKSSDMELVSHSFSILQPLNYLSFINHLIKSFPPRSNTNFPISFELSAQ